MANKGQGDANKPVARHEITTTEIPLTEVQRDSFGNGLTSDINVSGLTKKAEPPPTHGMACNRGGNGGWLRRLVRRHGLNVMSGHEKAKPTTIARDKKPTTAKV